MPSLSLLITAYLLGVHPTRASASARLRTTLDSVCETLPSAVDSTALPINTTLTSKTSKVLLPDAYVDTLQQIIAEQFHVPPTLSLTVISASIPFGGVVPAFDTHIYFYIRRDGSITAPVIERTSLNPAWEMALLGAFDSVSRRRLFPPLPSALSQDSVLVLYNVSGIPRHDVPPAHQHSRQLTSLLVPIYSTYRIPFLQPGYPHPEYPKAARQAGKEDDVIATFTIDPHGRPIPSTVDILNAHDQEFITAVTNVLPRLRFVPATVAGCAVNAYVELPFAFRLGDR